MATTPDDPRPEDDHRYRRRPVLFGRPPMDDPEALERWIHDVVARLREEIGGTG